MGGRWSCGSKAIDSVYFLTRRLILFDSGVFVILPKLIHIHCLLHHGPLCLGSWTIKCSSTWRELNLGLKKPRIHFCTLPQSARAIIDVIRNAIECMLLRHEQLLSFVKAWLSHCLQNLLHPLHLILCRLSSFSDILLLLHLLHLPVLYLLKLSYLLNLCLVFIDLRVQFLKHFLMLFLHLLQFLLQFTILPRLFFILFHLFLHPFQLVFPESQ